MWFQQRRTRRPIKNYFPLPNEIFSLRLCAGEISVYSYLLYRADRQQYQCWPSYQTIGNALQMSKNTVKKYVRQLEQKGLIATEPTSIFKIPGIKSNGNRRYTILPIAEAVDAQYQRQVEAAAFAQAKAEVQQQLKGYDQGRCG